MGESTGRLDALEERIEALEVPLELRIQRIEKLLMMLVTPDETEQQALKERLDQLGPITGIGELTQNCMHCVRLCDLIPDQTPDSTNLLDLIVQKSD